MDPTLKKQPKPTPFSATISTTNSKPHHPPDPTTLPSPTVQNISTHFSKLYANHKILKSTPKGSSGGHRHPPVDTHLQAKTLAAATSSVFDSSCSALTKSKSLHGSRYVAEGEKHSSVKDIDKAIVLHEKAEVKKIPHKEKKEVDVKRALALLSKSQDSDQLKGFQQGGDKITNRPSFSLSMNGGRRKSFSCSQTELANFFSCSGVKVVSVDMPPFMQIHAVDFARKAHDSLEKFSSKSLGFSLKKEFDGVYGPAWHCIVGTSFGSFVTHSVGGFIYFSMDHKLYVLLFKTTVQKAESN
ncbi:PREDICTED: uncharacterized protein LOC109213709 [Nicotiana attenuata]|uniref:Dynein light chain, cytoplasmic n=1 Tax=Nicotiana attenuata TaxID=49451 RepID=A0A1J6KS32_NICAT|nr:PREDICTED: uncharacterized protein LOC109213709 [Nicotiana attenuata]XP_019233087.1 PREDICTED: uncharacterized protein LOC109213709 [Nicotiana attenuata]XP_019233088.1 PREDICTED: uncharacterized protein LOC109213709 [Nicotiana attenuata]OIT27616.1 hypothetical protein A4A49_20879 [Nicotiana attenuata]